MTRLNWGIIGERYYETGVDHGVLYVDSENGVPWNGLVSVTESPSGGESTSYYQDGVKFLNLASIEEYTATIQAFFSPPEFDVCDGTVPIYSGLFATHQQRKSFGFCYRTKLGNDVDGIDHGYKLHLIYNALASPSDHANETIGDSIEPSDLSWTISTIPLFVNGYKPTAHLVIDSRHTTTSLMERIEEILYGSLIASPRLPSSQELTDLFVDGVEFEVFDIGDGSYSANGWVVDLVSAGIFSIDHESVTYNIDGSFVIELSADVVVTLPPVTDFSILVDASGLAILSWVNPDFPDFYGIGIYRKQGATAAPDPSLDLTGATSFITGSWVNIETFTDYYADSDIEYTWSIVVIDSYGNVSSYVSVTTTTIVEFEISYTGDGLSYLAEGTAVESMLVSNTITLTENPLSSGMFTPTNTFTETLLDSGLFVTENVMIENPPNNGMFETSLTESLSGFSMDHETVIDNGDGSFTIL